MVDHDLTHAGLALNVLQVYVPTVCLCYVQLVIEVLPVDSRRAARYDEGPSLELSMQEATLISLLGLRDLSPAAM